jgi:hypothetical protein
VITKWALIKNDKKRELTSVEIKFEDGEQPPHLPYKYAI